ncbi:hypothetical protein [Streptomyces sp. SID12501]|uniref:Uncharacterized protein n=1 Tax=Streptomyces sp. SID12501 TaxID=2706042 RepID=A0A6B3BZ42_9ACTN|nr:hypothetical protein [Streptomyces sp. SID12501]NEC89717.1 hypothetical protein [Streptomyces sp. SID12501]
MSAEPRSDRPEAQPARRTFTGNVLFAAAFLLVFATTMGGAFACVFLMLRLGDSSPLSSLVHEDGRGALVAGGIVLGAIPGLYLPLILIAMVRGTGDSPRMEVGAAGKKVLGLVLFDVYVFVLAVVASLLGWILPAGITNVVAVVVVGFSWIPLALFPWEKVGMGGVVGLRRPGSARPSISLQKD